MKLFGGKRKNKKFLVSLPIPSFTDAWAQGKFDSTDYYALTGPIKEWSADYPFHCLSESAPGICDDGWGIVTWKLTVYIYSNKEMAAERSKMLSKNVKPFKLKCLSCFAKAFSNCFSFVDMVLDESWHIEGYVCRGHSSDIPGVSHLRLSAPDGLFQLQGCEASNNLEWIQYPSYGEPNHPMEWCRPVAFPFGTVMHDHSPQGGPMDVEMLAEPESLNYYNIDGVELGRDASGMREAIFTRATGPIAFADLKTEPVRLTTGEGVWIPIATKTDTEWNIPDWAEDYRSFVNKLLNGEIDALQLCRGCQWYTNKAMFILEQSYVNDEQLSPEERTKAIKLAIDHLEKAVENKPWDWYAKTLLRDIKSLPDNEVPALIYADRCGWMASAGAIEKLENEYENAIKVKPNYHLAMHNRALAYKNVGDNKTAAEILKELLKKHPLHAQALFDLGVIAGTVGDEKLEMKLYAKAIKSDPTFALPYYNIGKTYEDNSDIKSAKKFYEMTLKHNPHYIEAAEQLINIMWTEGDYNGSYKLMTKNIESDPRRLKTYLGLFQIAHLTNHEQLAMMTFQSLKENLPRVAAAMNVPDNIRAGE